jgi:hypothetical protein
MRSHWLAALVAGMMMITTLGCGETASSPSSGARMLNLMITDSPFSDAKAVLVTFSEVGVHRSDGDGWQRLPFADGGGSRTCDLKKLETAEDLLGVGGLAAGRYTQIRLMVSEATLYFDNAAAGPPCATVFPVPAGRSADLEIPSGEVKLNREFELKDSGATTILIDFDGDKSIHQTGNGRYMMSPVISVVSVK